LNQLIGRFWAVGRTFHEQLPFDIALEDCIENPHYRWLISKASHTISDLDTASLIASATTEWPI
jgi:hypothetical protein